MLRKLFLLLLLTALLFEKKVAAQDWVNKMKDPSVNFFDVQKSFNKYWKQKERSSDFVGIDDVCKNGISYSVFPNPTNGATTLILQSSSYDDLLIEIRDITSKIVYEKKYPSFSGRLENTLDLAVYEKGVYMLSIKNSKGITSKKIVVY